MHVHARTLLATAALLLGCPNRERVQPPAPAVERTAESAPVMNATDPGLRHVFTRRFGGPGFSAVAQLAPVHVVADGAGNSFVGGSFEGQIDLGAGPLPSAGSNDLFVTKLGPGGATEWARRYGSANRDVLSAMAVDGAGNLLLAVVAFAPLDFGLGPIGSFGSAIVLVKLDPGGQPVWQREYGTPGYIQFAYGVAADQDGNVFLTGRSEIPIAFDGLTLATRDTPFLVALGPNASPRWGRALGGSTDQVITTLRTDGEGRLYFGGEHEGSTIDGVVLPRTGQTNLYVGALDAAGAVGWAKSLGDGELVRVHIAAGAGDLHLGGPLIGTVDFGDGPLVAPDATGDYGFLARLGPRGEVRWKRIVRGEGRMALGVGDDLFMAGGFVDTIDLGTGPVRGAGGGDVFIARLDGRTGNLRTVTIHGDAAAQSALDLAVVPDSSALVVAGLFAGAIDLGGGPVTSASTGDLFVTMLAP